MHSGRGITPDQARQTAICHLLALTALLDWSQQGRAQLAPPRPRARQPSVPAFGLRRDLSQDPEIVGVSFSLNELGYLRSPAKRANSGAGSTFEPVKVWYP